MFVKKNLKKNVVKGKKYRKFTDHCYNTWEYRGAAHSIHNFKYSAIVHLKKNSIACHNGSNYYYHLIIKELAGEFKKLFTCLGENTEKYWIIIVSIANEVTRINKNRKEVVKNRS